MEPEDAFGRGAEDSIAPITNGTQHFGIFSDQDDFQGDDDFDEEDAFSYFESYAFGRRTNGQGAEDSSAQCTDDTHKLDISSDQDDFQGGDDFDDDDEVFGDDDAFERWLGSPSPSFRDSSRSGRWRPDGGRSPPAQRRGRHSGGNTGELNVRVGYTEVRVSHALYGKFGGFL